MSDKIRFRDADFRPTVFFKPTDQMGVCLPAEEFRRYAEIALRHRPNFTELIDFLKDQKDGIYKSDTIQEAVEDGH